MVSPRFQDNQKQKEEVASAASFDFVIPYVHSGDGGQELRKALATLKNVLDWSGKVWIVGDYEEWFKDGFAGLTHLPCPSDGNKWVGIQAALTKACKTPEVSERFYYSNDDIYINDQFFYIPPMYRETIDEQTKDSNDTYSQSLIATKRLLERQGVKKVLNYEAHTPLPVNKANLLVVLNRIKKIQDSGYMTLQLRTYYGNMWRIGGEFYADGKHKEGLAITSS